MRVKAIHRCFLSVPRAQWIRRFLPGSAFLLLAIVGLFRAGTVVAAPDDENLAPILTRPTGAIASRASRLGTSAAPDTIYVGYTPGHSADNGWSVWAGRGLHRPPTQGGMWDFEPPYADVHGDSLQGWWSYRNQMTGTGGLTIPDHLRPWRALDFGNVANYVFGAGKRTFGVVGVWHVDGGNTVVPPAATNWTGETDGGVKWAPLAGNASAWMGLRRHGDNTQVDPITNNPFNEDVLIFDQNGAIGAGGSDKKFPGFGGQMDQMLYRDIDLSGAGDTTLTVSFQYRTQLSTSFGTNDLTRQGWFVHDPLTVITGGSNPNYIQNNSTVVHPPTDSLMVYVGAPSEGSVKLSDGAVHAIYDPLRRWFGEVIRSNEGLYKEILSRGGNTAATNSGSLVIPGSVLGPLKAAGANRVRLVFRVKTERSFNDETQNVNGYSSNGVGAAIIDNVTIAKGLGAPAVIGAFESQSEIDNNAGVPALDAWKSTGKPPQPFHHVHQLSPGAGLLYQDICGPVGDASRICDMQGQVVSAGDHDHNERSGGTFGTAEQEPFQGIWSPTIHLTGQGYSGPMNNMGLTLTDATPTDDYYIDYEVYTGIFDFFNEGNAWRTGFISYPSATTASGIGEHPRWGETRFPGGLFFDPDKQCLRVIQGVRANGMMRTTNVSGIPDSVRIYVGTRQECYRFNIPQSEFLDGAYWDNLSLDIVDGAPELLSVDIWHWISDTFPFNDSPGIAGIAAVFDTTTALVKSGLNIAPTTASTTDPRFDVPGDTTVVNALGDSVRMDLVFRILPGPGNYVNPALGVNSQLKAKPNGPAPIPVPASGVTNFWSNYMFDNGAHGSPGGHPTATGGPLAGQRIWSPHVWNSARCDTAQINVFPMQRRGVLQIPSLGLFMTAYHETELTNPHRGVLGVPRNICFVADTTLIVPTSTVICGSGAMPVGVTYPPAWVNAPGSGYNGSSTTKEGTKILPDGLLTPGSHVEYFFRREDMDTHEISLCPDTNRVFPQPCESSSDGHRWQEFSVLPDRWKASNYTHPVLGTPGRGTACMLFVDLADRRGSERTWVGIADTINATSYEKYGAHNGWHAAGNGADINDPAGFVRRHIGQPGTTWDMLGVKAGESLNSQSGGLGSRGGVSGLSFNDNANVQINGKTSRIGPTEEMLNTYYKVLYMLSGDLNSKLFGPFKDRSSNDYKVMQDFLLSGNAQSVNRGLFAEGNGFVEATDDGGLGTNFLTGYLGVALRNPNYMAESQNTALGAQVTPTAEVDPSHADVYGVSNSCTTSLDVLDQDPGLASETAVATFYEPVGNNAPYISGLLHHHTSNHPWITLTDGFDLSDMQIGRRPYMFNVMNHAFGSICQVAGSPCGEDCGDAPGGDARALDFLRLDGNPARAGYARITFGLARAERATLCVYDVGGRRVRTIADRVFPPGEHSIVWDGYDSVGSRSARGIYFVRVRHADGREDARKLVMLR